MHDVSEHVYSATVDGIQLEKLGGSITFDSGSAPHVTANLTCLATDAVVAALDPLAAQRVSLSVSATFATSSQSRTFDLMLRDARLDDEAGTLTIMLSSDEGRLLDFGPLEDDYTAFELQDSLRAVVNHVLGVAIPGAELEATPDDDADVSVYSDAVNMIPDPSNQGDGSIFIPTNVLLDLSDTSWAAEGSKSINLYSPSSSVGFVSIENDAGGLELGMTPGRSYVFSATGRIKVGMSGAEDPRARRLAIVYRNGTGDYVQVVSDPVSAAVGTAQRVSVTATLPLGITEAFVRAYHGHAAGEIQWDAFRLSEASLDPTDEGSDYFDGDSLDTDTYAYAWSGDADMSTSQRTALITRAPESLLWRAGDDALTFLSPILQAAGFRLVCDEQRRWTLRTDDYVAPGVTSVRFGVNMIGGSAVTALDSGLWMDARVTRYRWTDANGDQREAIDAFALNNPYIKMTTLDLDTPYPGPGRSEYAVRRSQGRGRQLSADAVANWNTTAEQGVSVIPQHGPSQTGVVQSVTFNLDDDTMSVTTRTRETPVGSIDALEGTIDGLAGTIDSL